MMADAGLDDDRDRTAELPIARFDNFGVLLQGHDVVRAAADVQQGNLGLGQRTKIIDRVQLVFQRCASVSP